MTNEIVKKNIQAYDSTAEEYYEKTKEFEEVEIKVRADFLSLLPGGGKILDFGCGPGLDAKIFSDKGFHVIGIDLSVKLLEIAKKIAPKAEFKVMDMLDLKFNTGSFNGIWASASLLCFEKKEIPTIMKNLFKILKPKGILGIVVKEGEGEGFELDKRYSVEKYFSYYSLEEMNQYIREAGFTLLKGERLILNRSYHTHPWLLFFAQKP